MSKNEGNQKLKFFIPLDFGWTAPYIKMVKFDRRYLDRGQVANLGSACILYYLRSKRIYFVAYAQGALKIE